MMQAIEFKYESENGVITIPEKYRDWFKKSFQVILLARTEKVSPTWLGCMSDTGQILGDIVSPLDDNLSNWEVLAQ
jgi:hypothetical protein